MGVIDKHSQNKDVEIFDAEAVNRAQNQTLYARRKPIHPKRASGSFRAFKWWIMIITLGIYYLTPWIRWDRGIYAPDQAVLVDLAGQRFFFFFIEIWPQEFFYVAGMLVMAGIGLFLVTSTFGRAWCGYTCPQTVWVDLFLVIERAVEGERNQRIKLDAAPWNISKIAKKIFKHFLWLIIAVCTGGAWIFYFADAPTLLADLLSGHAEFVAYATVGVLTLTTYTLGGLMREQVCTYMCPWPRIQAAMLDENSLIVTYNDWRGEPRAKGIKRGVKKALATRKSAGDCVECKACIAVCPMGIDIRDGQQLECISCALCIDACDGVMQKLGKEKGLISYATLAQYNANMKLAGAVPADFDGDLRYDPTRINPEKVRDNNGKLRNGFALINWRMIIRPRTLLYALLYAGIGVGLIIALLMRDRLDIRIRHDRNPVSVVLRDGSVRNGYEIKVLNMITQPREFSVMIKDLEGASIRLAGKSEELGTQFVLPVAADQLRAVKIFVTLPRNRIAAQTTPFEFVVEEIGGKERVQKTANFEAPENYAK